MLYDIARPAAMLAYRLLNRDPKCSPLLNALNSSTMTDWTFIVVHAVFDTCPIAVRAFFLQLDLKRLCAAKCCLFE